MELFELPRDATRVWDLEVPIIINKNRIDAYITNEIGEPAAYNELCYYLMIADEADTVYLHINTPGGLLDTTFMLIDAMRNSKAKIIGHISGTVASAGTIIALSCNDLQVSSNLSWMSHYYSAHLGGKGHEIKTRQNFTERTTSATFRKIHEGFFTPKEIQSMIDGKDFWLDETEVAERWANKGSIATRLTDEPAVIPVTKPKRGRPSRA